MDSGVLTPGTRWARASAQAACTEKPQSHMDSRPGSRGEEAEARTWRWPATPQWAASPGPSTTTPASLRAGPGQLTCVALQLLHNLLGLQVPDVHQVVF